MLKQQVRIIAGKWRSRKIQFPETAELRPTPDRIRETVFNWLAPYLLGARCLDLFAGSGVLGFEALSRGANSTVFLEQDRSVIQALRKNATLLTSESEPIEIIETDALTWLKRTGSKTPFDIVFIDPPYQANLSSECFALLENQGWLNPNAFIYFESNQPLESQTLPTTWQLVRDKKAGQVHYYLAQKAA